MNFDIFSNPELKRNAWVELRTNRVWAMLGLMAFVFFFSYTALVNQYVAASGVMMNTALSIFYFMVAVWGSKNAADAVAEEINQKTWDRQRMSGQNPWTLVIGKLFGPTLFQWLGGLIAMLIYFIAALDDNAGPGKLIELGIIHICLGLLTNMIALLLSLLTITGSSQSSFSHSKINTTLFFIISIVVAAWIFAILVSLGAESGAISWYGIDWNRTTILISMLVFIGWSLIGIHQNLRTELQYRNKAGYWIAFLLFVALYFYGFMFNDSHWDSILQKTVYYSPNLDAKTSFYYHLMLISGIFFCITQFLLVFERKAENEYQNFKSLLRKGRWKELFIEAPLWFSSCLAFVICMSIVILIQAIGMDEISKFTLELLHGRSLDQDPTIVPISIGKLDIILCYLSFFFLMARDIFFSRYLFYKTKFKNKLLVVALYYVIVYWAIPALFIVSDRNDYSMIAIFLPFYSSVAWRSFIALLIQAGAAWWWHRYNFKEELE